MSSDPCFSHADRFDVWNLPCQLPDGHTGPHESESFEIGERLNKTIEYHAALRWWTPTASETQQMTDEHEDVVQRLFAAAEKYRVARDALEQAHDDALEECSDIYEASRWRDRRPAIRGLYALKAFTLEEIGRICGISRARVWQVLREAGDLKRWDPDEA